MVSALVSHPISVRSTPSGRGSDLRPHSGCSRRTIGSPRWWRPTNGDSGVCGHAETLTEEIAAVPNDEWDFAKYTQAVADQCAQLARVVDGAGRVVDGAE